MEVLMNERPLAIVPVWFYDDQTGYQDFRQRIGSLASRWRVIVVVRDIRFLRELEDLSVSTEVLPSPGGSRLQMWWWCLRLIPWIAKRNPDLVFLLGSQMAPVRLGLPASYPTVLYWNVHPSQLFDRHAPTRLARWFNIALTRLSYIAAAQASVVLPIGARLRDDLVAHGVHPLRAVTVPLGVSENHSTPRRPSPREHRPGEPLRLIIAGSINAERGRDVMFDGIALLKSQSLAVHLTLIGATGPQLEECRLRIQKLGIAEQVTLFGRLPGQEIPALLAKAHIGLSLVAERPWNTFNPPTKIHEYMVNGLPVIVSNNACHRDLLAEGGAGWFCEFNAEDFARLIRERLANPAELEVASKLAYQEGIKALWSKLEPDFIALCRAARNWNPSPAAG
jgi:glycosyltransferase involved in cell wall biosynthesis